MVSGSTTHGVWTIYFPWFVVKVKTPRNIQVSLGHSIFNIDINGYEESLRRKRLRSARSKRENRVAAA